MLGKTLPPIQHRRIGEGESVERLQGLQRKQGKGCGAWLVDGDEVSRLGEFTQRLQSS